MSYKKILILKGGYNEEHEISLSTAQEVNFALKKLGYETDELIVNPKTFIEDIDKYNPECCFNALHGPYGEDGKIQKILFDIGTNFTHSGIEASKIAFNKIETKKKLEKTNVNFLESNLIYKSELSKNLLIKYLDKYNSFVLKPVCSGSSYGVNLINSKRDIDKIIELSDLLNIYKNHKNLIIEPYVDGKELTVTVLEKDNVSMSIEVTEIISTRKFFDYDAKYKTGFSKHILPAKLPNNIYKKCLEYAKLAHDSIGCKGVSRSDFIFDSKKKNLFFLEINTQPGLTPISLVPEQLKFKGINFLNLINLLLKSAKCQK